MAKFTGWKKRYSYLDDFQKGMDGTYYYNGRHYRFRGTEKELKFYKRMLGLADFLMIALAIISGCLDAGAIWRLWFVLIPYAIEIVAVFLLVWKTVNLFLEKEPLKEYIYKKNITWYRPCSFILMIGGFFGAVGAFLCMLLYPELTRTLPCIFYIVIKLAMVAIGIFLAKCAAKYTWEPDPSEMEES